MSYSLFNKNFTISILLLKNYNLRFNFMLHIKIKTNNLRQVLNYYIIRDTKANYMRLK